MGWPPRPLLLRLCRDLGLACAGDPGPDDDPVEQRLGRLYQRALGGARRSRGAYYTPPALVDYLVEHTLGAWLAGRTPAEAAGLRLLDPACGAGAFLAAAYRRLLRAAPGAGRARRLEILRRHVHGIELDPEAARLSRLALGLVLLEEEAPALVRAAELPCLEDIVVCGDALAEEPAPAFDVVLGNPPYLGGVSGRTRQPPERLRALRARYRAARGTFDGSVPFQELALRRLRPGGRAGLLVPNKFLAAPFGAAFRQLALEQAELRLLADLSAARAFSGAAVYPVIYVLEARPPRPAYTVEVHRFAASPAGPTLVERSAAPLDLEPGAPWTPLLADGGPLLRRLLAAHPPLGGLCPVVAAATADEAYRLQPCLAEGPPPGPAFRFVTSGAIDRYRHRHGEVAIRYLGRCYRAPYLPADAAPLSEARRRQYGSEKLLLASMTRRLRALWDGGALAAAVPAVQVLGAPGAPPLKYLLGLLNSRLLSWIFQAQFSALALAGGYLRIGPPQIGALPICLPDAAARERVVASVERLMAMAGRLAPATERGDRARAALLEELEEADRGLDRLVYELYGLDPGEAAVVERATGSGWR